MIINDGGQGDYKEVTLPMLGIWDTVLAVGSIPCPSTCPVSSFTAEGHASHSSKQLFHSILSKEDVKAHYIFMLVKAFNQYTLLGHTILKECLSAHCHGLLWWLMAKKHCQVAVKACLQADWLIGRLWRHHCKACSRALCQAVNADCLNCCSHSQFVLTRPMISFLCQGWQSSVADASTLWPACCCHNQSLQRSIVFFTDCLAVTNCKSSVIFCMKTALHKERAKCQRFTHMLLSTATYLKQHQSWAKVPGRSISTDIAADSKHWNNS